MTESLPLRNCGRCAHWGATRNGPNDTYVYMTPLYTGVTGTAELPCALDQRGHDRKENPGWTVASDKCSKWKRKEMV